MEKKCIGRKEDFAIEYAFVDEDKHTELSMFVEGKNILVHRKDNMESTVCWNLDELVKWLKYFVDNMRVDPYPVDVEGEFAAQKDENARDVEIDELDKYYDKLDAWCIRHRWHTASAGGTLPDVYFQLVDEKVEISWNNKVLEDNVEYTNVLGGASIDKKVFIDVVGEFISEYESKWS